MPNDEFMSDEQVLYGLTMAATFVQIANFGDGFNPELAALDRLREHVARTGDVNEQVRQVLETWMRRMGDDPAETLKIRINRVSVLTDLVQMIESVRPPVETIKYIAQLHMALSSWSELPEGGAAILDSDFTNGEHLKMLQLYGYPLYQHEE